MALRLPWVLAAVLALGAGLAHAQQRPATEVEALNAIAPNVRIPINNAEYEALSKSGWRAPLYSAEQTASFVCVARQTRGGSIAAARTAHEATLEFEDVKRDVRAGIRPMSDLVRANNVRQSAVAAMVGGRSFKLTNTPERIGAVRLVEYDYRLEHRNGEQVAVVDAVLQNESRAPVVGPIFTIATLDRFGLVLADTSYDLSQHEGKPYKLEPGKPTKVQVTFDNLPFYTHEVRAHLGRGGWPRNYRACMNMEPFHPPGGLNLAFSSQDAEQRIINEIALGVRPFKESFIFENMRAQPSGSDGAYQVTVNVRNRMPNSGRLPKGLIILIDEAGTAVGAAPVPFETVVLPGNASMELTLSIAGAEAFPAAKGEDPLKLMRRISVLLAD